MNTPSQVDEPYEPLGDTAFAERGEAGLEAELQLRIAKLERQLRLLRADMRQLPADKAEAYQRLEWQLLEITSAAARLRPELSGSQGHPLLAEISEWHTLCAGMGGGEAVSTSEDLSRLLIEDEVTAWETEADCICTRGADTEATARADNRPPGKGGEPNESEDGDACFECLMRTTLLEFELEAHPADIDAIHERFAAVRRLLRERFLEQATAHPPTAARVEAWTKRLTDRAETMLAAIDDLPPHRGALQLRQVADDLSWFLQHLDFPWWQRRRLKRKLWRLQSEYQERALQDKLERQFGKRLVGWFDTLIVLLIFVVLGLLVAEMTMNLSPTTVLWLQIVDAACCAVFLWEFFYRLALAPGKVRWFLRHFLIDLVPSIPLGLIFSAQLADTTRGVRAVRLARIARFARYFRVLGFMTRGIDRLARQYGRLLNRNVILYPTRFERARARLDAQSAAPRALRLRAQLRESWKRLLAQSDEATQAEIMLVRLCGWHAARAAGLARRPPQRELRAGAGREIPAEAMLRRLAAISPADVEDSLGEDLASRIARIARILARAPFRWMPVIRAYVPRINSHMSDTEVAAAAARSVAAGLRRHHDRWLWFADLYGTVSPSQFVDRVGTMLVKSSFRPAYRLALFGGIFLIVEQLIGYINGLRPIYDFLNRTVGPTLMLLGGVCFVVLGVGWYLKRLAREATEFYERAVQAQFLHLTEQIRSRNTERAAQALHRRVLKPEWRLQRSSLTAAENDECLQLFRDRIQASLLGTESQDTRGAFEALDRVVLLYRDSLDGALYVDNDTRTTSQLLGNPSVEQALSLSARVTRQLRKQLSLLDLDRQKSLLGGPYLWFNFISRSIAHSVACLIVDYNRHAVPLHELPLVTGEERQRYEAWLRTSGNESAEVAPDEVAVASATMYVTTAFTALHFLDFDTARDREAEQRFGPAVLARLRRDRSQLIRRVFGTYPLHRLPKDQRMLNMYAVYENWLSGGRALFLPLFVLWRFAQYVGKFFKLISKAVGEVRHLNRRSGNEVSPEADFVTAVRKIGRMRSPVVLAAIRLRAMMDAEFLGVSLPGETRVLLDPQLDADLRFLDAEPEDVLPLRQERRRVEADVRRLTRLFEEGLLGRAAAAVGLPGDAFAAKEHRRAATVAYLADYRRARSLLSAREILTEVFSLAQLDHLAPPRYFPRPRLWRKFCRFWRDHHSEKSEAESGAKDAAWTAVVLNRDGARTALEAWDQFGDRGPTEGETVLGNLLRHPSRISEQLITVRTIQTLAMLDVLAYREHVFELGQYAETGDEPGELLTWDAVELSPTAELGDMQPSPVELKTPVV